jgi:hypothetical protein
MSHNKLIFLVSIISLLFFVFGAAQLNLRYLDSKSECYSPRQVTFHPTDRNLVAMACLYSSEFIRLFNVEQNTLNKIQSCTSSYS